MTGKLHLLLVLLGLCRVYGQSLEAIPSSPVLKKPAEPLSLSCLNSQTMVSIPSSPLQNKPGETLNHSCRGTGHTFTTYGTNWIHQPTGKPLEWMGWINTNTGGAGYAKTLEGQIELTKDSSVSMTHVKLSGLKAEDSAVYYWACWVQ
ncbi:hypothetical protein J4Q44_G00177930 [Coregonus suidteri]|uniref:Immunoglobulin V-set domain-containing protein n=1 Tax=Coregonus suidteri TaxID=861788 RepID=A0AAN8LM81_9TELE